ncbi:hypothetical protein NMY22_g5906 [Coprinellus aureogranulatus]|nr:hypothetical protein NMY22_g5906 [Coprinellus aureogranulatus]
MSSGKDQPVEYLPSLPPDDGRVKSPVYPPGYTPRGYGDDGKIGEAFGEVLYEIWHELVPTVADDDTGRGQFTQGTVSALHDVWPDYNYIIVHTAHTKSFDGSEGEDWGHGHGDFPTTWSGDIGYEIYWCRSGVFALHGDGGYQNWAWSSLRRIIPLIEPCDGAEDRALSLNFVILPASFNDRQVDLYQSSPDALNPSSGEIELGKTFVVDKTETVDIDAAPLNGGILLRVIVVAPDPFMKALIVGPGEEAKIAMPPFTLGQLIYGLAVARVVRSENDSVKVGDHVYGMLPYQHYVVKPDLQSSYLTVLNNHADIPWSAYLGVVGLAGMTAYMGWKAHVKAKQGENIFISAAAGAVGSLVVQLAKLDGLRVIASSGSPERVAFTKEIGAEVAFNYKEEDTDAVLQREGPIDLYWDNVGGKTLDLALKHAAMGARFIECGMISTQFGNLLQVITKSISMFGVNVVELTPKHIADFYDTVPSLVKKGKVKHREVRFDGLGKVDEALVRTMNGTLNDARIDTHDRIPSRTVRMHDWSPPIAHVATRGRDPLDDEAPVRFAIRRLWCVEQIYMVLTSANYRYVPALSFVFTQDVTLYGIEYTSASRALFSPTGEILTVKPVSTLADGRTAYEVQSVIKATLRIDASTTSTLPVTEPPTTTTYTYVADATQHEVNQYITRGNDVIVVNAKCSNRREDGSMICEDRVEVVTNGTSTEVTFQTETGSARPFYTLTGSSGSPGATSATAGSNAASLSHSGEGNLAPAITISFILGFQFGDDSRPNSMRLHGLDRDSETNESLTLPYYSKVVYIHGALCPLSLDIPIHPPSDPCASLLMLPLPIWTTILSLLSGSGALNLTEVLNSTPSVSRIGSILAVYPALLPNLTTAESTFFAPSDDALDSWILSQGGPLNITMETLSDLIAYHILPRRVLSANLSSAGGVVVDTALTSPQHANLQGSPNVVYASAFGDDGQGNDQGSVSLYSGVGEAASITSGDVGFEGGVVHIIDHVLNMPQTCTQTAQAASLSTLTEAFRKANLWQSVDTTPNFTCFAPTNEAFQAAGLDIQSIPEEQVTNLLKYHLIEGEVGYSTALEDGKQYQTMLGIPVTIHKRDGRLFVNNVTVRTGNVIMSNGVAHVLDGVLDVLTGVLTPSPNATVIAPGSSTPVGSQTQAGSAATSTTAADSGGSYARS